MLGAICRDDPQITHDPVKVLLPHAGGFGHRHDGLVLYHHCIGGIDILVQETLFASALIQFFAQYSELLIKQRILVLSHSY